MNTRVIAITGGIGCGKSALCDYFSSQGYPVIDTDRVAKDLVAPQQPGLLALIDRLGSDYLTDQGELNRDKLRQTFFTDPQIKQQVESILHPMVRQTVRERIEALKTKQALIFIAIPVLHQLNQPEYQIDQVLLVECDPERQLARVTQRDQRSQAQIEQIIRQQATPEQRRERADDIIENNGSLAELHQQAETWLQKIGVK